MITLDYAPALTTSCANLGGPDICIERGTDTEGPGVPASSIQAAPRRVKNRAESADARALMVLPPCDIQGIIADAVIGARLRRYGDVD